jgi:lycopene cyclase domain-containing protein
VGHGAYLLVLGVILCGSLWLEVVVRTRVLVRFRRLALAVLPVAFVFTLWDWYAVSRGHWSFAPSRVTGWKVFGLPVEELLFFCVVPLAAILTLEAVRAVRGWSVGDERVS